MHLAPEFHGPLRPRLVCYPLINVEHITTFGGLPISAFGKHKRSLHIMIADEGIEHAAKGMSLA